MDHIITVFLGYCAIMNPLANTAVFVSLTEHLEKNETKAIARKSLLVTFLIIFLFACHGKALFEFFGISLPALRIGGGLLVFMIGYHMLHGESSALHNTKTHAPNDNISISPLAVPILAGPGTIATTMNYSASGHWFETTTTLIVFLSVCLITYCSFIYGQALLKKLGDSVLTIITRLMGLILAIIGVQMVIDGIFEAISYQKHLFG